MLIYFRFYNLISDFLLIFLLIFELLLIYFQNINIVFSLLLVYLWFFHIVCRKMSWKTSEYWMILA